MAESSAVAFGRYLRTLRERRGYSLDHVESLSKALPERIGKGYLSRCENGRQRLAFSKMITLCRVYDVPSEVLIERMELDLELDRVGGPETEGLGFEELTERGKEAAARGALWDAYGYFRDALPVAATSQVEARFKDALEQSLCAIMNHSVIVSRHGRHRSALYELEHVRSTDGLGPHCSTTLLELVSQRYRSLGDLQRARHFADEAVRNADALGSPLYQAFTYSDKALIESETEKHDAAIELYKDAFSLFQKVDFRPGASRVLLNLAQLYFDIGRMNSAKRALTAAERLGVENNFIRDRALVRILSGEIAVKEHAPKRAVKLWREALDIAMQLHDPVLRFKAEFQLYKHALSSGDRTLASSLRRLLRRRATWVPENLDELVEFRSLSA
jgi:tetratricopeptide (TPR) repeat protein